VTSVTQLLPSQLRDVPIDAVEYVVQHGGVGRRDVLHGELVGEELLANVRVQILEVDALKRIWEKRILVILRSELVLDVCEDRHQSLLSIHYRVRRRPIGADVLVEEDGGSWVSKDDRLDEVALVAKVPN
jgi:hypothetical protein